jgi:hypothetical protein
MFPLPNLEFQRIDSNCLSLSVFRDRAAVESNMIATTRIAMANSRGLLPVNMKDASTVPKKQLSFHSTCF